MTRKFIYGGGLAIFLAATAMTIASVVIPRWISWNHPSQSGDPVHVTYGLHSLCSSLTGECEEFPSDDICQEDRTFCSIWRSVGFLMSFAVVIEGMTFVTFLVMLNSGKQKRTTSGWKTVTALLAIVSIIQCVAVALIAHVYEVDDRFFPGWHFDTSFVLCATSFALQIVTAIGLVASAFLLEPEGGYELIPDEGIIEDA